MSLEKFNIRNSILILIVIAAAATRFLHLDSFTSWFNFTPIGAIAMFGGVYYADKLKAYFIPFITLLASDLILNYTVYYHIDGKFDAAVWTYISFMLMVTVGRYMKRVSVLSVVAGSFACVFIHWIVSDISVVMMEGSMYPRTFNGYLLALWNAIPWERNLLVSTLAYSAVMFGGFEYAKAKFPSLRYAPGAGLQHA
ncbi:DUF6580 family putative transport protein [Pedobacter deserti]|uniref:DUF6580 family putative transport protein n=1 Tax=Pedobacter deserti TaxID=2817382 RepID=UPI0021099E1C|nr:DUF6580 family putative transport protein [Pedobacter sp. SYSU D00382]